MDINNYFQFIHGLIKYFDGKGFLKIFILGQWLYIYPRSLYANLILLKEIQIQKLYNCIYLYRFYIDQKVQQYHTRFETECEIKKMKNNGLK